MLLGWDISQKWREEKTWITKSHGMPVMCEFGESRGPVLGKKPWSHEPYILERYLSVIVLHIFLKFTNMAGRTARNSGEGNGERMLV